MTDFVDHRNDILSRLNEINEKISSNNSIISSQEQEIVKTEGIIVQFQGCLKDQNDMLQMFIKEKEKMEEDKEKLVKLLQEYDNPVKERNSHCSSRPNTDNGLASFDEAYNIHTSTKSIKYYREISERLSEASQHNEVNYLNQTVIPNKLKASIMARRMLLYRIDNIGEYPLENIIRQPISMSLDIHVSTGSGELLSLRGRDPHTKYHATQITNCKTFSIKEEETLCTRFIILVNIAPMVLGIDIHNPDQDQHCQLTEREGYTMIPPVNITDFPDSFLKQSLSKKEMLNKLLFFDASFAENVHDSFVPIALTVMDYDGNVPINTVLCPRMVIRDYGEIKHGLTERDIIGAPDSAEIMKDFYRLAWDKILVGHNLAEKIKNLNIDRRYLCGMRDLQTGYVIRKMINSKKSSFKLSEITDRILKRKGRKGIYSAEYKARTIRDVYMIVESKWEDDIRVRELNKKDDSDDSLSDRQVSIWEQNSRSKYKETKRRKVKE